MARRCAVLLRGGVPATRVCAVLDREAAGKERTERDTTSLRKIAARAARGDPVAEAIAAEDAPPWRVLAVAWRLAEESGAPLAPALDRIGGALRELERLGERREVLLSGPRATVRLVAALPLLSFGIGALLGFNPLGVLLSPAGVALFCGGGTLLGAGVAWARMMRRRVERADRVDGIECELVWVALGGGAAPETASRRVVDAIDEFGASWVRFDRFVSDGLLATTIRTAAATGVSLRPLLLEEAAGARARAHAELEQAAERLGIRVLLPLGLCVLPAFVALGVAPVVISMLGGM
ncbi:tight adherence protein B [Leucobacter luti]|uniref:type II secretion system F family protein n=1 Tax=Leucobacter luti TaxID=340320 RepID=UPI00104D7311|nr:type II secretion system F family protein [Leucobacter luti]MCW2289736.1 tight adherence protein B [Leucobacter luti]TCK34272.1 tight adherence protein B [Leucobacter luti]